MHALYKCKLGAVLYMFAMMDQLWIRGKKKVLHKERVGSVVESEWVSTVLRQPINQPFRSPFPPTSCKCSAIHSGRQESAGSHWVRIQQTYFFLLI